MNPLQGTVTIIRLARGLLPQVQQPGAADTLLASHARTFHFAARFLPASQRPAVVTLYAFFRTLDDLVDESLGRFHVDVVEAELEAWRSWLACGIHQQAPREDLGRQLAGVISTYDIPTTYFQDLIDGLSSDLQQREIADFDDLRRYSYQVASTVGLAMAHVLGATTPQALLAARDLGIAMQLTNILRDVGEDLANGRLYLPIDELKRFDLSRTELIGLMRDEAGPDERFRALMRLQIARADAYYRRGMIGIWLLPADCRMAILIAARLYRRILTVIERNGYDSLRKRAYTTRREKVREATIALAFDTLWRIDERSAADFRIRSFHDSNQRTKDAVDAVVRR